MSVLLDEVLHVDEPTTNPNKDLSALLHFDMHSSLAKLIDALAFSEEHDLNSFSLWVVVDEVSEGTVNRVVFVCDIDCWEDSFLKFLVDLLGLLQVLA